MKILLDEDVPEPLANKLASHNVQSVRLMGWASIQNGQLLMLIESESFDIFITGDKSMKNQQRLTDRPFMTLVLSTIDWPTVREHISGIIEALKGPVVGEVRSVYCGTFLPHKFRKPSDRLT